MKTPPEAVKELLREILRFHYTRLKSVKEYPKVEKRCVWRLNRTRRVEESVASCSFMVTIQRSDVADVPVSVARLFPTHGFALDREQVPKSTKHLHIHQLYCHGLILKKKRLGRKWTHMTSKHVEEEIESSSRPSCLG